MPRKIAFGAVVPPEETEKCLRSHMVGTGKLKEAGLPETPGVEDVKP